VPVPVDRPDTTPVLAFEAPDCGQPADRCDASVFHGGKQSARLERTATSEGRTSLITVELPVDFVGKTLDVHGWLKVDAAGQAGLWQRQSGRGGTLQYGDQSAAPLTGTQDWTEVHVELPLDPEARTVAFGAVLKGEGRVWLDDLEVLVDGKPLATVPITEPANLAGAERDHAFDAGSGFVPPDALTPVQVENLVLLGKVWGFVKYRHPRVTSGDVSWDYELFRVLPDVVAAPDGDAAQAVIDAWLAKLGEPDPCDPCAVLPADAVLKPRTGWTHALGTALSGRLDRIDANRDADGEQYHLVLEPWVGNPRFAHEATYEGRDVPDAGLRLLAVYRLWNMIEYWAPGRELIDEPWDGVLADFVPRALAATTSDAYAQTMMAMVARIDDTHANLWSSLDARPPYGDADLPVIVRFVEGKALVIGYADAAAGPTSGLLVGDVVTAIDGQPVTALIDAWRPMYADSNEAARLRDIGRSLLRGPAGPVALTVERDGATVEVQATRAVAELQAFDFHDHGPTPPLRRLSPEVAYLTLSQCVAADAKAYLKAADGASLLVIDLREYPSDFIVFELGQRLVTAKAPFVKFTMGDPANPGAFVWADPVVLKPKGPHFAGKVAILVDEVTQSQAEYTTMAFRTAPGAIVVGSTTAGADGNVSGIPLPGGLRALVTGLGVFYPDGTPTQQVGIVPDVVATPTIAGIAAGRDEVFDAAVKAALGREPTADELTALDAPAPK
jgi:C-terminal processing protease CtpA/Prc